MEFRHLGKTGLKVTRLCFGTLPMGPLEADQSIAAGSDLIAYALAQGINFLDSAKSYRTHAHVKEGIKHHRVAIISTKTPATGYEDAARDIEEALRELGRPSIDIMLLHSGRDGDPLANRVGALAALTEYKKKGIIRAVGLSAHYVKVVWQAAEHRDIDIIHPLINRTGLGIVDGTAADMRQAIDHAHRLGKGIFAMKPLGGGNLLNSYHESMQYVLDIPSLDSIAIGMLSKKEVDQNIACCNGQRIAQQDVRVHDKQLKIMFLCQGCGKCVAACPNFALKVVDKKAQVDKTKCLLCGYCTPVCPQFAIRVI